MRSVRAVSATILSLLLIMSSTARAQTAPNAVPRVMNLAGVFQPVDGQPLRAVETVTVALYTDPTGGTPLWQETQSVAVDSKGRYAFLLGAASAEGIPPAVLAAGARWLGTTFDRPGEVESPRVPLTSVPYALRAADAETLGGHPASAYLLSPSATSGKSGTATTGKSSATTTSADAGTPSAVVQPGTTNFLAKYVNAADVGNSALYEINGNVGLGTTTPFDLFHVRFTNTAGSLTGFAVQNLGNTATSYSGMLFYDQNGALGQFQGFNNVTHEYRINNIASSASINFMTGSVSRLLVSNSGNIGIGTVTPAANLEVSNSSGTTPVGSVLGSSFTGSSSAGTLFIGRKARGTSAAPTAVLSGDILAGFAAQGYGATGFSGTRAGMSVVTAEDWTDTAQGAAMIFSTTPIGSTTPLTRLAITNSGFTGLGTLAPSGLLEVARNNGTANVFATGYGAQGSGFKARSANGTLSTPTASQAGDELAQFTASGFGATAFNQTAGFSAFAAENWTDTAQGTGMAMFSTAVGSNVPQLNLAILPNGNVGIGTPSVGGFPTATDKLQVFGDIRIGNLGTNGCIKNFGGTGILGTCVSDRRFKTNITPFGSVLNRFAALQPVHYYWRAADFPDQHFGDSQAYGLIAQDVEQVFPELVVTRTDGYKAVDYSELPMLTIQAVKELKAENDELKRRLADVERVLADIVAKK
jgi:Chaperone of endosialidase